MTSDTQDYREKRGVKEEKIGQGIEKVTGGQK